MAPAALPSAQQRLPPPLSRAAYAAWRKRRRAAAARRRACAAAAGLMAGAPCLWPPAGHASARTVSACRLLPLNFLSPFLRKLREDREAGGPEPGEEECVAGASLPVAATVLPRMCECGVGVLLPAARVRRAFAVITPEAAAHSGRGGREKRRLQISEANNREGRERKRTEATATAVRWAAQRRDLVPVAFLRRLQERGAVKMNQVSALFAGLCAARRTAQLRLLPSPPAHAPRAAAQARRRRRAAAAEAADAAWLAGASRRRSWAAPEAPDGL
eukprot:365207-Chlamydomonas_euryale.AAC.7